MGIFFYQFFFNLLDDICPINQIESVAFRLLAEEPFYFGLLEPKP
jgi:hypothetical protein